MNLDGLSNEALLANLQSLCAVARRTDLQIIVLLNEVEERRLHLKAACSSMFEFCVKRLGLSESSASRKIQAARLVRRFPCLLTHVESGRTHFSNLGLLSEYLTEENVEATVQATSGMSKSQVLEFIAALAPRPDVPASIVPLTSLSLVSASPDPCADSAPSRENSKSESAMCPQAIRPLAPERYALELTIDGDLRAQIDHVRDLMRHRNPSGDLEPILRAAIGALTTKLERERYGTTNRPQTKRRTIKAGAISRAVRREVFARDGRQCTFTDELGRRCEARAWLELDHVIPRARGGLGVASNLRVRCKPHNRLHAETCYGTRFIANRIHAQRWVCAHHRCGGSFRSGRGERAMCRKSRHEHEPVAGATMLGEVAPVVNGASSCKCFCEFEAGEDEKRVERCGSTRKDGSNTRQIVVHGLVNMGFQSTKVKRVVSQIVEATPTLSVDDLLRKAIAILTM